MINWLFNLAALAIRIIYCSKDFTPGYLKIFLVYLFVSAAIEIPINTQISRFLHIKPFGSHQDHVRNIVYNLYTPFELFVFAWFLFQVVRSSLVKNFLISLLVLFSIFFIVYSTVTGLWTFYYFIPIVLECIIILIPCLAYYRELFTQPEHINLVRSPSFWFVTGIFFYLATIIPYNMTSQYLIDHGLIRLVKNFYAINNLALVITYLLFIRGFTCRIKKLA